jgi:hypothetical protein
VGFAFSGLWLCQSPEKAQPIKPQSPKKAKAHKAKAHVGKAKAHVGKAKAKAHVGKAKKAFWGKNFLPGAKPRAKRPTPTTYISDLSYKLACSRNAKGNGSIVHIQT